MVDWGGNAPSSFADGGNRTRRNLELSHPNLQLDTWTPLATHLFTKLIMISFCSKYILHNCTQPGLPIALVI